MTQSKIRPFTDPNQQIRWMIRKDFSQIIAIEQQRGIGWSEQDFIWFLQRRNVIGMVLESMEQVEGFMLYEIQDTQFNLLRLVVSDKGVANNCDSSLLLRLKSKLLDHRRGRIVVSGMQLDSYLTALLERCEIPLVVEKSQSEIERHRRQVEGALEETLITDSGLRLCNMNFKGLADVLDLLNASFNEPPTAREMLQCLLQPETRTLMCYKEEKLFGFAIGVEQKTDLLITHFFVNPNTRKAGVGSLMLTALSLQAVKRCRETITFDLSNIRHKKDWGFWRTRDFTIDEQRNTAIRILLTL